MPRTKTPEEKLSKSQDCYFKQRLPVVEGRPIGSGLENGSLLGSYPTTDIYIEFGGQRISCLFDTGSMVSTIIESSYNSYLHDIPVLHEKRITLREAMELRFYMWAT